MRARLRDLALTPLWIAQLPTASKSFERNRLIGSPLLNRWGLHAARVALAHRLAWARRRRHAGSVAPADRLAFDRDGFVVRQDFLPPDHFAALLAEIKAYRGPFREIFEGDTVLRKIALDRSTLKVLPALAALLRLSEWRGLLRYAGSRGTAPVTWVQAILRHAHAGPADPQTRLHADTFHPTVKAWLFLTDVAEDAGPFTYVPGSHRLTSARLAWERRRSLAARQSPLAEDREGSLRIDPGELAALGLPPPRALAVPGNTLVVADTFGFHARGPSAGRSLRVEIWAYGRRSPFPSSAALMPWTSAGLGARSRWAWRLGDALETFGLKRNRWRQRKGMSIFDEAASPSPPATPGSTGAPASEPASATTGVG